MKRTNGSFRIAITLGLLATHAVAGATMPDRPLQASIAGPGVLSRVEPERPGWVQDLVGRAVSVVEVKLRADGSVGEIVCVESLGTGVDLNDWNLKVADAVRLWRFEPGVPAKATVSVHLAPRGL